VSSADETFPEGWWPLSLVGGIRSSMSRNPSKIAVRDSNSSRDYRQLINRIDRVTSALFELGINANDHVAVIAGNSIEYIEVIGGASQAGVAVATLNPRLSTNELITMCDDAVARVIFVDQDNADRIRAGEYTSVDRIIEFGDEFESWVRASQPIESIPMVAEENVFTIPYTSGTTGQPKGVLVSHRSRIMTIYGMAAEYGCYSSDDRFLAIAPLCHGAGMVFALATLYFGGYTQLMNRFDPTAVLHALRDENISGVFMVPTHFHGFFELEDSILEDNNYPALKTIISNAAALPQNLKEKIVAHFGSGLLHETYGSTEASIVSNLRPADQLNKKKCVGLPFNSTLIKILDEEGNECGPNVVGELFSYSPCAFNGYWNNDAETEAAFKDGWITVGDLAYKDDEGYLYIVDRKKDMVISGGINIYPREIEDVLARHPGIVEAAVIGVPNEKWGEQLKAFIVVEPDQNFSNSDATKFCEEQLSAYKVPREFEVIKELPRNANGKILKSNLRLVS
jgi:long-chain acyl-CoA synthetase